MSWYHVLEPLVSRMVASFDDPASDGAVGFWNRRCATDLDAVVRLRRLMDYYKLLPG